MSTKATERRTKENGHPTGLHDAKESTGSSAGTAGPCTNGQDKNSSLCADSDGDSSIAADDSLCSTPTHRKFKVPSRRPRASMSERKRSSNASFSHEHSQVLDLEREMRKLLAERNQLSKQLYASKQENTKLESKVQVAIRDKSSLMSQMASLSKHNRDLSRGKSILLAKAFSSVDVRKTRSLEQSLKQANRERRAKQKELEKLNIQMNMSSKEMQEKLLAWLDEREEREIRIEDLECEVRHLTECQAVTEEENNSLKESVAAHEEACKVLQDQQSQLELTYQEKERELCGVRERLTEERDELKQSLHSAQENLVEREKVVSSLQEQLSEKSQQITTLQTQLQTSQSEVEAEREERTGAEEQLTQSQEQFSEKVNTLEERVSELSQLNSDLQSQLKSTQTEVEEERKGRERAEVELTQCREQLGEKLVTLEEKVVELSKLNSDLQSQLKTTEREAEGERERREGAEAQLAQFRVQLEEATERANSLGCRVTELSRLNSDLNTQLDSLRQELETERGVKQQLEDNLATMTTQLHDKGAEIEQVLQKHTRDLEAAHTKCSGLLLDLEKAVSEGKATQALLRSQLDVAEADKLQAVCTASEVKERERVASSQLTQLKKENMDLQTVRDGMRERLEHVQDGLAALQEQVDGSSESEAVVAVQEQMTKELVEVKLKLTQQQTHNTKVENELGEKVHELEEELEKMKAEREQLEMAYLDLQEKCRPFQDQLDGLTDVNALLQSQAALARKEAQEVSDQFASLVGHQNSRQKIRYVKKIRDENTALKMELNQLRMELSKQKKQLRRIQMEVKAGPAPPNPTRPLSSKN